MAKDNFETKKVKRHLDIILLQFLRYLTGPFFLLLVLHIFVLHTDYNYRLNIWLKLSEQKPYFDFPYFFSFVTESNQNIASILSR